MRKFLFICFTSEQSFTGGLQCSNRNLQSLKTLFGENNVDAYVIKPYKNKKSLFSIAKRIIDIVRGYMGGLTRNKEIEILDILKKGHYTDLFIDSSLLGVFAQKSKKRFPQLRVFTFFHNFEYSFVKDSVFVNHDYIRFYWLILAAINEKKACKYSDKIITLNNRDTQGLYGKYGRKSDIQIPITLKNTYMPPLDCSIQNNSNGVKTALFIGSYFFGNTQGIKWFCKYVLPHVDIQLIIVGAGMKRLYNEIDNINKVQIFSDVPDLTPYYEKADFMLLPILSGSGMKVKTAEALMHGKYIIGTSEALRGYEVDNSVAQICDTKNEFIDSINNFIQGKRYFESSRKLFEHKYSFESSLHLFDKVLAIK